MDAATNSPTLTVIGDYRIVREIGRGGMGVVYEAVQTSLGRKVALKILSTGLGLTPQAVQRFQREAESAARLHHTNIVPIYATGAEHGVHFYAMELIEGPSLDHVIRQMRDPHRHDLPAMAPVEVNNSATTLAYENQSSHSSGAASAFNSSALSSNAHFDTVARLVAEVADALAYAHRNGVVHRDIKPANMLVSPEGRLSLNDFGLARVLEQPGMTTTGEILGTPAYMSPEQLTAGRTPLDHRTDIYSLGATLYELLTLQRPFLGERRDQVLSQILHKEPRPPRNLNKKVPFDLETICLKAMEKDPDRRYQSADEMAEDLRRYVNRFAISARRVGPLGKTMKWVLRHPGMSIGIACAGVAIILAAFFANRANEAEKRRLAEQERSQNRLTTLEREHALENALVAATSGDLDQAERAIAQAESHGATPGQLRMLRGQVAFFRGDYEQALFHLDQAIRLNPDSIGAHSMLAATCWWLGDWTRGLQELELLKPMQPRTSLEYMLKGYALLDSTESLKLLDQAVAKSRSPIARAFRAEMRYFEASEQPGDGVRQIENALSDIRTAKELLPDNLYVVTTSVITHLVAARIYRETGNLDAEKEVLQIAAADAHSLEAWIDLSVAGYALWCYYNYAGTDQQLFDVARRMASSSTEPTQLIPLAHLLCRRRQFEEALKVLESRKFREIDGDCQRVYVLAELHPNDSSVVRGAMDEMYARYAQQMTEESHYSGLDSWRRIAFLVGMKNEATTAYQYARQKLPANADELERRYFDFGCGIFSEAELLGLRGRRAQVFHAKYLAALKALAEGDRAHARKLFKSAKRLTLRESFTLDMIRTFIIRMDQDPNWPPWIPIKD